MKSVYLIGTYISQGEKIHFIVGEDENFMSDGLCGANSEATGIYNVHAFKALNQAHLDRAIKTFGKDKICKRCLKYWKGF